MFDEKDLLCYTGCVSAPPDSEHLWLHLILGLKSGLCKRRTRVSDRNMRAAVRLLQSGVKFCKSTRERKSACVHIWHLESFV